MKKIANDSPIVQYIGNGVATEFAFNRMCWGESDIHVYLGDDLITAGYTVQYEDLSQGANIVFDEAPANGTLITISREVDLKPLSDFVESSTFRAAVMNDEINHLYAAIQQVGEEAQRGFRPPLTAVGIKTELPTANAGKAIMWSEDGTQLVNSTDNFNQIISNATTLATASAANATHAMNSKKAAETAASNAERSASEASALVEQFNATVEEETDAFLENAALQTGTFNKNALEKISEAQDAATAAITAEERARIIAEGSETEVLSLRNNLARSAMDWALLAGRNSAGIVPDNVKKMRIVRDGRNVSLFWKDPDDTIIEGQTICTWHTTYIVRKAGDYPVNAEDGEVLCANQNRSRYENTAFVVTEPNDGKEYFYSAFPASSEGAKNLSPRNRFGVWVYGFFMDESDPVENTCVSYDENCDNRFYQHAYMDFANDKFEWGDWDIEDLQPKPCMLTYAGEVDYFIDKNDFTKKVDGSASDVSNINYGGNAMVYVPRVFTKKWRSRNKRYVWFSNVKYDEGFECARCLKSDGTYSEASFMPMFEGTKDSSGRLRSIATNAKALASTTAEQERAAAKLNGAGYDITTWADEDYLRDLFVLMFKRLNSQKACGYGATASTSALTVNTGCSLTKKGRFWGTAEASANGMKMFGIENFTSHRWRRFVGCLLINGTFYVKLTKSKQDGTTVDDYNLTGDGYINTGVKAPSASESYIMKVNADKNGGLPTQVGGSSTTYYSDAMWTNLSGTMMPLSGGVVDYGVSGGVFAFACNRAPSHSAWHYGASLSYHAL